MSEKTLTVRDIAELLGVGVHGDDRGLINSMASPDQAGPTDITFAVDKRFASQLLDTRAGCAIVSQQVSDTPLPQLVVENVKLAVAKVLGALATEPVAPAVGVHTSATISPQAELADDLSEPQKAEVAVTPDQRDKCGHCVGSSEGATESS